MEKDLQLEDPWLVAVWPGMGGIAQIAGRYLVRALGAQQVAEVPPAKYFDLQGVKVHAGLIEPAEWPRSLFYGWKNPSNGPDLVILVADEQPTLRGYRFCDEMLAIAQEMGVKRIVTFAAMATPVAPDAAPRVFAATNRTKIVAEMREHDVHVLEDGMISGLNGVAIAAAAERDVQGMCLLGEFPFFASSIANPKASAAVLRKFAAIAHLELDLTLLDQQAAEVETRLLRHLKRLQEATGAIIDVSTSPAEDTPEASTRDEDLDPDTQERIEALFTEARQDRSKAMELKAELDRHKLFKRYEDRFLDLFKQAD